MSQDRRKAADNRKKSFMINKVNNYPDLLPVMQSDVTIVTNKLDIREGDAGNGETIAEATSRSS